MVHNVVTPQTGGSGILPPRTFKSFYDTGSNISPGGTSGIKDRRIRISPKPLAMSEVLGDNIPTNILQPLFQTSGMMFPYTPMIQESINVNYEMQELVHSNQPIASFKNVGSKEIQISGTFTAQNEVESRYSLAVIHYLRTVTKMYFGIGGNAASKRGTPPPILLLNGYGTALFHNLPIIITTASITFPQDVDYVQVTPSKTVQTIITDTPIAPIPGKVSLTTDFQFNDRLITNNTDYSAWIPTKFEVALTVVVQNTPTRLRRFDLDDFRTGSLIKKGGWI